MNRVQTKSIVSECELNSGSGEWDCTEIYHLPQDNADPDLKGWIDLFQPPVYAEDAPAMLQIQPFRAADGKHYRQLAKISTDGKME